MREGAVGCGGRLRFPAESSFGDERRRIQRLWLGQFDAASAGWRAEAGAGAAGAGAAAGFGAAGGSTAFGLPRSVQPASTMLRRAVSSTLAFMVTPRWAGGSGRWFLFPVRW